MGAVTVATVAVGAGLVCGFVAGLVSCRLVRRRCDPVRFEGGNGSLRAGVAFLTASVSRDEPAVKALLDVTHPMDLLIGLATVALAHVELVAAHERSTVDAVLERMGLHVAGLEDRSRGDCSRHGNTPNGGAGELGTYRQGR